MDKIAMYKQQIYDNAGEEKIALELRKKLRELLRRILRIPQKQARDIPEVKDLIISVGRSIDSVTPAQVAAAEKAVERAERLSGGFLSGLLNRIKGVRR